MNGIICLACECLIQANHKYRDGSVKPASTDELLARLTGHKCPACEAIKGFREALESDIPEYSGLRAR